MKKLEVQKEKKMIKVTKLINTWKNNQISNENDNQINFILFHTGASNRLSVLLIMFW